MAFDQNLIPVDLRPLNIARTISEDSRTAPMNTNGRISEGFSGPGVTRWLQGVRMSAMGTSGANSTLENHYNSPNFVPRAGGNAFEQASDEAGDDSNSGKKVKFLCSFGGKIFPRPSDGALRYVGGQTRIISIRREASFAELDQKMVDTYGQNVIIKYQLPDEDLDALVSVACQDDMENMMDEYQKLVERSPDGSAKLRVFLFLASELDSSSVVQDFQDSGQRYVEAVNGIADGVGSVITRKESITSAISTHNSDMGEAEAVDSMLSPKENITTYQDISPKFARIDSNPNAEASGAPLVIPVLRSAPPPVLSIRPEQEIVRAPPVTIQQQQQMCFDLQQPGVTIPQPASHLHAYADLHQETINRSDQMCFDLQQPGVTFSQPASYMNAYADLHQETPNRADYVQFYSQTGFPTQLSGAVRPMYAQQQFRDNSVGVSPHQFIPGTHMTMNPSSHLSIRPNVGPPLLQPQQVRLEHYPNHQSYNAYQGQVPPPMVGGGFVWHQAHRPEQMAFSEGWVPHQQVIYPGSIHRYEECYMCQKALPHAHSDAVAQGHTDRSTSNVSDLNSVFQSLQSVDSTRGPPISTTPLTGAVEGVGVRQTIEGLHENDSNILQKEDNPDHSKAMVPQDVVDLAGGLQSPYGVPTGTFSQLCQENTAQQLVLPSHYQIKPDDLMSTPIYSDTSSVRVIPSQISDRLVQESSKDYSGRLPGVIPREDALESCFKDHLRQIDGLMENLQIHPPEVFLRNELSKSPVDNLTMEDNTDSRQQQVAGRVLDANWARQNEILPCSSSQAPQLSKFQPVGSYEVAQAQVPRLGEPSYNRLTPDEVSYGNTAFSCVESVHVAESITPPGEWKDNPLQFQPNMVPTDAEAVPSDDYFPSYGVGDIQDSSNSVFSNHDPWKLQHGSQFPPPRPNKILMKKETFGSRNPFGNQFGNFVGLTPDDGVYGLPSNLEVDFGLEQTQSSKGSAEEKIKQELKAVAEGVAENVLQLSMNSNPDFNIHGMCESSFEAYKNSEVEGSDVKLQQGDRFEGIKTGLQEKSNLGFPVSEGIGRLQIIKNDDLEELRELGSGTFGTVYHGKWRGSDVAIKRINDRCFAEKPSEQDRMRSDFWNEAIKLADLHHPNVVAFYGVVLDGPGGTVATVTEFMVNGSLRTALQKNERNLDKRKRLIIAMDVAFGMEYLHGKNLVHFDLKSDNLLVNLRDPHRPICKVGDLGLSKVKCQTLISGGVRGTLPWMAPELLNGSSSLVSEKVDVFSFGIVLWELLTGEEPYADLHYGTIIGGIVSNTLRPPVPESCDPEWRSLMEKCWSAEPLERPNFTEIANQLRIMATKVSTKQQTTAPS